MKNYKIIRNIMGQDIEIVLHENEMNEICEIVQLDDDMYNVRERLGDNGYENYKDIPDELIKKIAKNFRERMDAIAENMGDEFDAAVAQYEDELEQYKEKWKVFSKNVTLTLEHEFKIVARNDEEAEALFEQWSERHGREMTETLTDDAEYNGDFDYDSVYEEEGENPEYADIKPEDYYG